MWVFECSRENAYNFSVCWKIFLIQSWGNGDVHLRALTWKGVHEVEGNFPNCTESTVFV